ncbi:MAG: hypothetical protein CSA81_10085 [Acidobacteria bacterium]|nr:MAG: hypothetical protein CSA81_10085 [Acidobacteriota bacterium]
MSWNAPFFLQLMKGFNTKEAAIKEPKSTLTTTLPKPYMSTRIQHKSTHHVKYYFSVFKRRSREI